MKNRTLKLTLSILSFLLLAIAAGFFVLVPISLSGCSVIDDAITPEEKPRIEQIGEPYCLTQLKKSTPAEVLAMIHNPEHQLYPPHELLSKSKSVVASTGQNTKGYKVWFNMVSFDENNMLASRKYLLMIIDKPNWMEEPRKNLTFDSETLLSGEVLSKPYVNENARRVAIMKYVLESFRKDTQEINLDNKTLMTAGMCVSQAISGMLVKLDDSPAYAAKLEDPNGADFESLSFGTGKMEMVVCEDYATMKIRFGDFVKDFKVMPCCVAETEY